MIKVNNFRGELTDYSAKKEALTITHCVQATVDTAGVATAVKMFSMGRASAEIALVMPDDRTVYMSIDSSYKPFLKFVANNESDLTSGCLSTAQLVQTSGPSVSGTTLALCTDTRSRFSML